MRAFDLLIKHGTIITDSERYAADIGICGNLIADIDRDLGRDAPTIIDARGLFIFPGGVDVHTHLDMPLYGNIVSSDTFQTGTKAAAIGGTTSIIDFATQTRGASLHDTVAIWRAKADGKACIDYGLHIIVTDLRKEVAEEIPVLIAQGYTSFKVFMSNEALRIDDATFLDMCEIVSKNGALLSVHAENHAAITYLTKKLLAAGRCAPKYHAQSRPPCVEGEAVFRAISLASLVNAPLMIVHASSKEALEKIQTARAAGLPIMGETCPQYLLLSEERYEEENFGGAKYVMSPPLRNKVHLDPIWQSIKEGVISTVATDHCPFFMEQKRLGLHDFTKIPNGAPGIEARMAIMLSEGLKHGLSYEKIIEVCSTNPAKIFGMYPKKGALGKGSDADICLYDPNKKTTISFDSLHENVDFTPYEGLQVSGYPVMTIARGEIIAKDTNYIGAEARGAFIIRKGPQIL